MFLSGRIWRMRHRVIVAGVIKNERGEYLLCKKPDNLGVFAGQWGIPGGGIDDGERMNDALKREMREEVGLEIDEIVPMFFKDDVQDKLYKDGTKERIYMIYLVFVCLAASDRAKLNEEFEAYKWVGPKEVLGYDLNEPTRETFERLLKGA